MAGKRHRRTIPAEHGGYIGNNGRQYVLRILPVFGAPYPPAFLRSHHVNGNIIVFSRIFTQKTRLRRYMLYIEMPVVAFGYCFPGSPLYCVAVGEGVKHYFSFLAGVHFSRKIHRYAHIGIFVFNQKYFFPRT